MKNADAATRKKQQKIIMDILDTEAQLRSKKELIERFIEQHFPNIPGDGDVGEEFESFWSEEKQKAIEALGASENLDIDGLHNVIGDYLFTEKAPLRDDVISIMQARPSLKERKPVAERIISKIIDWVETFVDGVD